MTPKLPVSAIPKAPATPAVPPPPSPQALAAQAAMASAQPKSDAAQQDYKLAVNKGSSPDHIDARRRVARTFCEIHFPKETPADLQHRLDAIDYSQTLAVVNARGIDVDNPKRTGFLGIGGKLAYYVGAAIPPKQPGDPIYALEYHPLKT